MMRRLRCVPSVLMVIVGLVMCVCVAGCGRKSNVTNAQVDAELLAKKGHSSASSDSAGRPSSKPSTVPTSNLDSKFGLSTGIGGEWATEASLHPGQPIGFRFQVQNCGNMPTECPRVTIEPASQLQLGPRDEMARAWGPEWLAIKTAAFKNLASGVPMKMQVGSADVYGNHGALIPASMGGKLNPYGSKYYDSHKVAVWDSFEVVGFDKNGTAVGIGDSLRLSVKAKPGADTSFTGYIVVDGRKQAVSTVTVHVLNPD